MTNLIHSSKSCNLLYGANSQMTTRTVKEEYRLGMMP
jgi:hypothetical protein